MFSPWITTLTRSGQGFLSRETSGIVTYCFPETWLALDILSESVKPSGFSVYRTNRNKDLSRKKGRGVCFQDLMTLGVIIITYRNSSPFVHPT
jgi:hypothetical protein